MPRGISTKREREFQTLERQFKAEHRYPGREREVAARIVNKQRQAYGETAEERRKDRAGASPDRDLPIADHDRLTIPQVRSRLAGLDGRALSSLQNYERAHKRRKGLLTLLARQMPGH